MSNMVKSFDELTTEQQAQAGGKGSALARLYRANFPVPDGFVILPSAFVDEELSPTAWVEVQAHLSHLRGKGDGTHTPDAITFAVRSSAMSEDSVHASFAGEFETVLNVFTEQEIYEAIHKVYQSRKSERVQAYSQTKGLVSEHQVAVIIQQLVRAKSSGVLFTANPVTGQRDQAMISAAWGLGEAIVGGLVTPDTLIVDKATGRVLSRETADKQVMTVRLGGGTREQVVPEALRKAPVLSDREAADLVRLGTQIEECFGMPLDIEWVVPETSDGASARSKGIEAKPPFAIVQARPITALPEPRPSVPTEWKLPSGTYAAMRNNIVELMADPMTPLFGTLGRAAVNASLGRQLASFLGRPDLMPEELIISVNEYAYYDGSLAPKQIGRILLGSIGILRRMFTGAVERWVDVGRPRYVATVERWQASDWAELSSSDLVVAARELMEAAVDAYVVLVSGIIPAAWISEGLFTLIYNTLIKRRDDPAAPVYLMGFDSLPIQAEKSLYDLAGFSRTRPGLSSYLSNSSTSELAVRIESPCTPSPVVEEDDWREWQEQFQAHLQRYGHTIYNLDFANPVPADDPAPLLETCKWLLSGQSVSPHTRQQAASDQRQQATQAMLNRLRGQRLKLFQNTLGRAQRYAPLREDGLADVGLGYPLLRKMLREMGHRLTERYMIERYDDIFWLTQDEVEEATASLDRGEALRGLAAVIPQRKATWRAARHATPPQMLPERKILGRKLGGNKTSRSRKHDKESLKGVAASPGRATARACVVHGPEDFGQFGAGDILVAPLTTPAWTPLFSRAKAIVTDVGGPLSHGSIVAREYGIPAVLGTGSATKQIQSGEVVTVDGSEGRVYLDK